MSRLQINFLAETDRRQDHHVQREDWTEGTYSQGSEGRKDDGKTLAFQGRLEWRKEPVIP